MDQYQKSGPSPAVRVAEEKDFDAMLKELRATVDRQESMIKQLQVEIRRLKSKLDQHAGYLNRNQDG